MSTIVPFAPSPSDASDWAPPQGFLQLRVPDGAAHPLVCKLAAGYLELRVLRKATAIVAIWRTPQDLLDSRSSIVDALVEHFREAADAARHLARSAVHDGMKEAQALLPGLHTRTAADYADAILQRLEWARGPRTGEVIDFGTVQLIGAANRISPAVERE